MEIQTDPYGSPYLAHAVVVLGIEQTDAGHPVTTFMDPLTGRIETDITGVFWLMWSAAYERAFTIRP